MPRDLCQTDLVITLVSTEKMFKSIVNLWYAHMSTKTHVILPRPMRSKVSCIDTFVPHVSVLVKTFSHSDSDCRQNRKTQKRVIMDVGRTRHHSKTKQKNTTMLQGTPGFP